MNGKYFPIIIFLATLFLVACAQSPQTTQAARTPIPTPTQIALPSLVPTSTTDPVWQAQQAALLYSQDFESGQIDGLNNHGPLGLWNIVTEENGNHIYCNASAPVGDSVQIGTDLWINYALEMRVKSIEQHEDPYVAIGARLNRTSGVDYYGALNFQNFGAAVALSNPFRDLGHETYPASASGWYTLRLEVAGSQIKFYIDNNLIGSATDNELSQGMANFSVSPDLRICVDDIRVWALNQNGQIASLPAKTNTIPSSAAGRLATHKFPKLYYLNQDSDPTYDALVSAYFWDILIFDKEVEKSEWFYLGPTGYIRSQNPNAVILETMSVQEYFPEDNSVLGQEFVSLLKPEWIMKDIYGKPFPSFCCYNGKWSIMMNLSTEVNTFIPDFLNQETMKTGLVDGIYYDGTNERWWQAQPDSNRPGGSIDINNDGKADSTAQLNSAMDQGLQKILIETRRVFPTGSIITGNAGWDGGLLLENNPKADTVLANLLNGRMIEGFLNWGQNGINWLKSMRAYYLMQDVSVEPRTPLIMAYCTGKDFDHLRYVLASALMLDGYFTCTNSQETGSPYTANWWYDEYSVDLSTGTSIQSLAAKGYLGSPINNAYNPNNKDELLSTLLVNNDLQAEYIVWRRDFQNGIVLVDPSGSSKTIDLNGTYRKIMGVYEPTFNDGSQVTKITLPPQSGIILLNLQ